ncbi:hypothetical protein ACW9H6_28540 [Pseudomonas sp. SDO528_S397]
MNGHNIAFVTNPTVYIGDTAINSVHYFQKKAPTDMMPDFINLAKMGSFDLIGEPETAQVILTPVSQPKHNDVAIRAYWCPFIQGMVMPGFVDLPKYNPPMKFMFTAAMNGCALVVTETPGDNSKIRVYHNQHPHEATVNNFISSQGQPIKSLLVFEDYGRDTGNLPAPNGFNFMHYRNGGWRIFTQPQKLNLVTSEITLNRSMPCQIIDV